MMTRKKFNKIKKSAPDEVKILMERAECERCMTVIFNRFCRAAVYDCPLDHIGDCIMSEPIELPNNIN